MMDRTNILVVTITVLACEFPTDVWKVCAMRIFSMLASNLQNVTVNKVRQASVTVHGSGRKMLWRRPHGLPISKSFKFNSLNHSGRWQPHK